MSKIQSVGAMNQLSRALRQHGFTDEDVIALTYFDLEKVRRIIYGLAIIKHIYDEKYVIHKIWSLRKKITGNFFTRKSHDIGIMNSLADVLESNNYSPSDVTRLKQFSDLNGLRLLVRNLAEIDLKTPLIDCISEPKNHEGFLIYEHQTIDNYKFEPEKLLLFACKLALKSSLVGRALADELLKLNGPNANVAGWLSENIDWIPKSWDKESIIFPGTVFSKNGEFYCRYIYKFGELWHSHWCVLTDGLPADYRIAEF